MFNTDIMIYSYFTYLPSSSNPINLFPCKMPFLVTNDHGGYTGTKFTCTIMTFLLLFL